MGRIIKKISVLIISLFVCVNILSPLNKVSAEYDSYSGIVFRDTYENDVILYEVFDEYTYDNEELTPTFCETYAEDITDSLVVKYNSSDDTFTLSFKSEVELTGVRLLCGSNLIVDLSEHDFTMNFDIANRYEGISPFSPIKPEPIEPVGPIKSILNSELNIDSNSNSFGESFPLKPGFQVNGSLTFVGSYKFQFNYGLDNKSFVIDDQSPLNLGMGACIYCTDLYIGDDNVGPEIVINEIRDEQYINMNGIFLTAPINADGSECIIKNSSIEINSYLAGMSVSGNFEMSNSTIDIYRIPMTAPVYIGLEVNNDPGETAYFNDSEINIVEGSGSSIDGIAILSAYTGSFGLCISYEAEFDNCDINVDVSQSSGYSMIDYMSTNDRESISSFDFKDSYVTLLGGIQLTIGSITFEGDSNFYVASDAHPAISSKDNSRPSHINVALSDEGTGLFETVSDEYSWSYGFECSDSFYDARASYNSWYDADKFSPSYSSNYRWVAFQKDCIASIKDFSDPATYKTFTMFDEIPGIVLDLDNPFLGWYYTDKNGKERKFLNYIREDCVVYPKFLKDPIDPTGFEYNEAIGPTDNSTGRMPFYVDLENDIYYAYTPEGAVWIGNQEDFESWENDVRGGLVLSLNDPNAIPYALTITPDQAINIPVSSNTYTFTSNAELDTFAVVYVDGKHIKERLYNVSSGSTIIKFTDDFINSLEVGDHTITIVSRNGHATNKFTVKKSSSPVNPVKPPYIIPTTGIY